MPTLGLFRSCLRKEYRDQVIKMMRGMDGEYTRTSYRLQWVDPAVLDLLQAREDIDVIACLVSPSLKSALPTRRMKLVEYSIDPELSLLRLTLELKEFVQVPADFEVQLDLWTGDQHLLPVNEIFVAPWSDLWGDPKIVPPPQEKMEWKRSIDFLTGNWRIDFANTVFFRTNDARIIGDKGYGVLSVAQQEGVEIIFDSYNPHLPDEFLLTKQFHVAVGNVMADIGAIPNIPKDGSFSIDFTFLEAGNAAVQIEVRPDSQFSAYIPLEVLVSSDSESDPNGPRILGRKWRNFLETLAIRFHDQHVLHDELVELLWQAFPEDPELLLHQGRVHLDRCEFGAARDTFQKVLNQRDDARAGWWSFAAALLKGDLRDAENLMQRLNLSHYDLFDEAVETMPLLSDDTIREFSGIPAMAMSDDKAVRMLLGMVDGVKSEKTAFALVQSLNEINPTQAIAVARSFLVLHTDWTGIRRLMVEIATKYEVIHDIGEDIEILLHWNNQDPDDYLVTVTKLRDLISPRRAVGIMLESASHLITKTSRNSQIVALTLANEAAKQAASIGDYSECQQAMQLVEMNVDYENFQQMALLIECRELGKKIELILEENASLRQLGDFYQEAMREELLSVLENKVLLLVGGKSALKASEAWVKDLHLKDLMWVTNSDTDTIESQNIVSRDPSSLCIVLIRNHESFLHQSATKWIQDNRVPLVKAFYSETSIFDALRTLHSDSIGRDFIPTSCQEAVEWAIDNYSYLIFSPNVLTDVPELDKYPDSATWAPKIMRALEALNTFTQGQFEGNIKESFWNWAPKGGLSQGAVTAVESESTTGKGDLRQQRTFIVPKEISSEERVFMPAHLKFGVTSASPRIHFTTDFVKTIGKTCVGYVGPHLETAGYA